MIYVHMRALSLCCVIDIFVWISVLMRALSLFLQHVLQREENWNAWKNDSCPSFEREKAKEATKPKSRYVIVHIQL